jgi:hypothetical protein
MGANVLNLSLGGTWNATAGFAPQQAALQYARSRNVLPICSSGNSANTVGYVGSETSGVGFPARFPECVAVGSTDWFDGRAGYSSWGPQVELSAPGGQVFAGGGNPWGAIFSLSNSADNTYSYKQGTSMAAPQVAGLAALLYASGMTSADAVLQRMKETADDLGAPGRDPNFGYGRVNVYRAVTGVDPDAAPVAKIAAPESVLFGEVVTLDGSASFDPNFKPVTFAWNLGDGTTSTAARVTHTYTRADVYTATLVVTDQAGLTDSKSVTITVQTPQQGIQALSANLLSIFGGETFLASTQGSSLPEGTLNALNATLRAADTALGRGNRTAATNQMGAFINQVEALARSGRVTRAQADRVISAADRIIRSIAAM